ncbi:hypothetical protein [Nitriliruptor alkaliphilus]|uniref:hypothetical protein n=1 Tax=Nitriliruptor alkaliphilus TaxID=427918 RepID=UPI0006964E22|nr:hypothetical protein [Nitriliruptor alkaliphilus]
MRWAFALAGAAALMVAVAIGPRPPNAPRRIPRADRVKPDALPHRATLVVLLGSGAIGIALLAVGRPATVVLGAVVALAGTWGFPGVFWYALVTAYPATPGRITGTMAPAALGGVVGPIGFGAVATAVSYSVAWSMASAVALLAAAAMLVGARRLALTGVPSP